MKFHKILAYPFVSAAILSFGLISVNRASAQEDDERPATAATAPSGKLGPWDAMKIAGARAHGRPVTATFEFEDGHWIYGVMVASHGKLKEVEIDATTGQLGDIETATPEGEARELRGDLERAIKS
jgi:hypothetical protein